MNADWAAMRASDADRHQWAEIIKTAYTEGRLTLSEYDERLDQVMAAKTYADLRQTIADLPVRNPPRPGALDGPLPAPNQTNQVNPAYPRRRESDSLAVASLVFGGLGLLMFVPAIPAVICGHIAMRRARSRQDESHGLAFAGTALGYAVLALPALFLVLMTMLTVG